MDVKKILKVYNYVNDEQRSRINVKFMLGLSALLAAGVALVAFFMLQSPSSAPSADAPHSRTDYVGLGSQELAQASLGADAVQDRLDAWRAEHPGAVIETQERVEAGGVLVGYRITYREP